MKEKNGGEYGTTNGGMDSGWTVYPEDDGEQMLPILDDLLAPDEIEQIGDVGGGDDDHDGPEMARLRRLPMNPREFFFLSRMDEAIKQFKAAIAKRRSGLTGEERVPDEEWRRLGDEALGLVRKGPMTAQACVEARELNALGNAEFNRAIAFLKEVVLLEEKVSYEIGMAKHHMQMAIEATRAISRLTAKSSQEQRA